MKKIIHILTGWGKKWGFIPITPAVQKLSELRMSKCKRCSFSKESKVLEIINGVANYEEIIFCTKCTCPCLQKTLVIDESCPIEKW